MLNRAERLAALHQISAAEEAGSVRYGLNIHPALVIAIKDRTAGHQHWAARYAAYAREQMGIDDGDQLYA
ncbi:hypothetical protein E0H39_03170 [Rhizobium leguminosarum bv. viciae]|jgi:hypothetical protein|uniref:hypothetical protein n=1 Tax=Rhizobium leguminosarum TaxID=384 RepID=UPI000B92C4EC|nr:hypothetical protein [Rhizobium leguminosarum]ASS53111.1 hypothetical protein CHR56_00040 [Rhizobium leguminosarum bv. viciae]ASS57615.1 hypothetical protein CHR56_25375 [Rhizobium leguminosarum bv. viciae]ASS60529.1 hypothetical protein CHR56_39110 [Rhizobium leguminosarum bv. viciae]TBY17463.1 hypothetical protein E0H30_25920 [Rhizobium leguminosarum bv. viciae]TBY24647.1 hypothetical protein E0H37_23300 [Rhizobium leguminosarum bv. viciae]